MKIGIDVRFWGTQHAGIGRYTEELVKNLQDLNTNAEFVLFCRKKDLEAIPVKKNWRKVVADIPHYSFDEQTVLPRIFRGERLDLLHVPHFNVPIFYNRPFVVTIHDVLWHDVRGADVTTQPPFVYSVKYLGYRFVVWNAIKRAKRILVPSNTVRQDLVKRFRVPASKIVVTYEGVSR